MTEHNPELEEAISDLSQHVSGLKKGPTRLPSIARDLIQRAIEAKEAELGGLGLRIAEAETSLLKANQEHLTAIANAEKVLATRKANLQRAEADIKELQVALAMEWIPHKPTPF